MKNKKNAFTLVELLAVIVILAIILVIAVPKVLDVINDSKKATLESTAKMIASSAEKAKIQNQVLGNIKEIDCREIVKLNDIDYSSCEIEFDGNTAKVTLIGSGKFEGLNICNGTKTNASGVNKSCSEVCDSNEELKIYNFAKAPYEVDDIPSCVSYISTKLNGTDLAAAVEPICNGQEVNGYDFDSAITMIIDQKLFTEKELVENNVLKAEEVKVCVPNLPANGATYISRIYNAPASGLIEPIIKYTAEDNKEKTVNPGIRYTGTNPNNRVYFNCEAKDKNNISYGNEGYKYDESCEVWRIIGVFNVSDGIGNTEKRMKIINTESTFTASWDSSRFVSGTDHVNNGYGINQWGESTYSNGNAYKGADLMQLLNGYYIGKSGSTCTYCNNDSQATCSNICDTSDNTLASKNMKPLTSIAKSMTKNAVWDTYAVEWPQNGGTTVNFAKEAYLQEKGISAQHTGKSLCVASGGGNACNDTVTRTTSWTGLVGLMSLSDIVYANGWLYSPTIDGELLYPWSISPSAVSGNASGVWNANTDSAASGSAYWKPGVWPSLYLKSNVQIISGDGSEGNEYKLSA